MLSDTTVLHYPSFLDQTLGPRIRNYCYSVRPNGVAVIKIERSGYWRLESRKGGEYVLSGWSIATGLTGLDGMASICSSPY